MLNHVETQDLICSGKRNPPHGVHTIHYRTEQQYGFDPCVAHLLSTQHHTPRRHGYDALDPTNLPPVAVVFCSFAVHQRRWAVVSSEQSASMQRTWSRKYLYCAGARSGNRKRPIGPHPRDAECTSKYTELSAHDCRTVINSHPARRWPCVVA